MADDNNAAATDSISSTIRTTPIAADSLANKAIADSLARSLKEVEVVGESVKHSGDKDIYTITRELRRGTSNTAELIGNLPGMFCNRATEELSYMRSTNIVILMDSVEKDASYIKNLSVVS